MVNKKFSLDEIKEVSDKYFYVTTRIRVELVFDLSDEGCFYDNLEDALADFKKMKKLCPTYHLYVMHKKTLSNTIDASKMFENLLDDLEESEYSDYSWFDSELSRGKESFIKMVDEWKQQFNNSSYGEGIVGEINI